MRSVVRELAQWQPAFAAAGYQQRHFFPHRFYCLPKCGPDGYKLARRMCGAVDVRNFWQIVIFAISPALDEFPESLFFDDDLMWHAQQFNRAGQVASVDLYAEGGTLFTMAHHSDFVQRISRHREFKTRVEKVFKGWHRFVLNCIANFAVEQGLDRICVPTSPYAMKHTDEKRAVQPELFERIYDRAVNHQFETRREGAWWEVDVAANHSAVMTPRTFHEPIESSKTICICHDIERGLGHRRVNPVWARVAEREAPAALDRMLSIERAAGVRATYSVVGRLLGEVRDKIERDGHCVAFHSYDHELDDQLAACRRVDYRIKGYRPPNSTLTPELNESELCWHNFEWLASSSSPSSFGFCEPRLENRVVKIPILFDDFDLYRKLTTFEEWRRMAIRKIAENDFVAFSLHDCYAAYWLPYYESFIQEIRKLGKLRTLNEVAGDLFLGGAE